MFTVGWLVRLDLDEQALRPAVITRKVGGCNRNAHAVLASLGATCRNRSIPVLDFLIQILRATDAPPSIARLRWPLLTDGKHVRPNGTTAKVLQVGI